MSEFIPLPGFEEYLVSKDGVFLSKKKRKKPLKPSKPNSGQYPRVKLRGKRLNIHRLLAKTFIPNPDNLPMVNHKDGNKFNYSLDNLEWCTNDDNMKHAMRTGLLVKGTQVHTNRLDEIQVLTINSCFGHLTHQQLADYFKVHESTITAISTKRNWKHLLCL